MHGNLLINRITDKRFREEWHLHLAPLYASLKRLNELRFGREQDPSGLQYLEAAMEFIESRDAERNFFWDTFIRKTDDEDTLMEKKKVSHNSD
ncbi:MAG: hypothetical protein P1R58_06140 [bacterium]|nr:hypothetical protein [bacterium]